MNTNGLILRKLSNIANIMFLVSFIIDPNVFHCSHEFYFSGCKSGFGFCCPVCTRDIKVSVNLEYINFYSRVFVDLFETSIFMFFSFI
jgi:hypothetical protein